MSKAEPEADVDCISGSSSFEQFGELSAQARVGAGEFGLANPASPRPSTGCSKKSNAFHPCAH